ncbi:uncharacterized protein [Maniola hyperantus]|uniref:uncharacterized protein n=1 Tax=Aphantopus hyperantus TaxID=2795564 RepID=UPI002142A3F3
MPCDSPWAFYLVGSIHLAMNLGRIPMLSIFGLLYCRFHIFCRKVHLHLLKNTDVKFSCKKYMSIYEQIMSTLRKTDFPLKLLMFTHLSLVFVDITNVQYKTITQFSIAHLLKSFLHLICNLVVFFPSLVMELIAEEIENMRVIVADRMISSVNEEQRNECRHFLQSLRQQPITYLVCRAFKMDSRLLLSYFSLVITYLICILQFKPFYTVPSLTANSTIQ